MGHQRVDRTDLPRRHKKFARAVETLSESEDTPADPNWIQRINRAKKRLSRILIPAFETAGGRYAQDRYELEALDSPIPAMHELQLLEDTPPDEELSHLLFTELTRERNRLSDALRWATAEIYEATG